MGSGTDDSCQGIAFSDAGKARRLYSLPRNSRCETSGAKALTEKKYLIVALKALRHPKTEFFSKLFSRCGFPAPWQRLKPDRSPAFSTARLGGVP